MLPTIAWQEDDIVMVDQRKLPAAEVYVTCKTVNDVAKAIKTMVIRGAPAIGVCAAMGLALGAARSKATGTKQFTTEFQRNCDLLAATRPTAVNLFWAIERMKRTFSDGALAGESVDQLKARLRAAADRIHDDDVASCRAIGAHGADAGAGRGEHPDALQRRARWPPPATAPRWASFAAPSKRGARSACWRMKRGRSCRARGSPRGSWSRTASIPR